MLVTGQLLPNDIMLHMERYVFFDTFSCLKKKIDYVQRIFQKDWTFRISKVERWSFFLRFFQKKCCVLVRTNISLMFLFPWLDWGIDISNFEKFVFLGHCAILGCSQPLAGWFWTSTALTLVGRKFSKSVVWKKIFEKFLEKLLSFPEIYFGHAGTI